MKVFIFLLLHNYSLVLIDIYKNEIYTFISRFSFMNSGNNHIRNVSYEQIC